MEKSDKKSSFREQFMEGFNEGAKKKDDKRHTDEKNLDAITSGIVDGGLNPVKWLKVILGL